MNGSLMVLHTHLHLITLKVIPFFKERQNNTKNNATANGILLLVCAQNFNQQSISDPQAPRKGPFSLLGNEPRQKWFCQIDERCGRGLYS